MPARLISVNIGTIQQLDGTKGVVLSGIFKTPVPGSINLAWSGVTGDHQADRRHHGGRDKAVNVYADEHYAYWRQQTGGPLGPGAFGENFTTEGLLEDAVCIGDTFHIGVARVQVTQPRQPCFKLAAKMRQPQFVRWVQQSGRTGFYLRVLQPGALQAGDEVVLSHRVEPAVSVAEANHTMYAPPQRDAVERLLAVAELSDSWRAELQGKLMAARDGVAD